MHKLSRASAGCSGRCKVLLGTLCGFTRSSHNSTDAAHSIYISHHAGQPISSGALYLLLQAVGKARDLAGARAAHRLTISTGFCLSNPLADYLIHVFALCGSLLEATLVFCSIDKPSVNAWHTIIAVHSLLGENELALDMFLQMQANGTIPNKSVLLSCLKACSEVKALKHAKFIHGQFIMSSMEANVVVGSTLVHTYAKCGSLEDAHQVFSRTADRDVVLWGAMIAGYIQQGHGLTALKLFLEMQNEGTTPDTAIFSCVLKACASIRGLCEGKLIHDMIIRCELESNDILLGSLILMYGNCGRLDEARQLFDSLPSRSLVSLHAMLAGYATHECGFPALELVGEILCKELRPSKFTYSIIVKACTNINALSHGRLIHDHIIQTGLESDLYIRNTLIDMYSKCGSLDDARVVFDSFAGPDEVSWGSIIAGYAHSGYFYPALYLFEVMQEKGQQANELIFSCALHACGSIKAIRQGMMIHHQILKTGQEVNEIVGSSLVDMYAKCCCLWEAHKVFEKMQHRTLSSWGALIDGCAEQGQSLHALELFKRMQKDGLKPSIIVYSSVLKACTRLGDIEEGRFIHNLVVNSGLELDAVVGNTILDMYNKCSSLEEARKVFDKLSYRDVVTWNTMIAGYVEHEHALGALELFDEMGQDSTLSDRVTFLCALKACGISGSIVKGRLIHKRIISSGINVDLTIGSALVDMYARSGSLEDAEEEFKMLTNPDVASWSAMIAGYALYGNCQGIRQCLSDMRQQSVMPDDKVFSSVLDAYRQAGHGYQEHMFFSHMSINQGIVPSIEHFNCTVDILGRTGNLNKAKEILESLPVSPDIIGWTSLLTACRLHCNMDLGRKCYSQAVELDPDCATGYLQMSIICTGA